MTEKFPIKATHKNFGEISITGIRTESNSNNNTMYQFRLNGDLVWGYDYEITIDESLPAPAHDGTAEENIESYWIESDDLGGGMHLMVFKSDYIRAMHRYAAPLRSEIERLKSELAASVSPKLVMPERKEFNRFGDHLDDMHVQTWNMVLDELRRLNPSLFK